MSDNLTMNNMGVPALVNLIENELTKQNESLKNTVILFNKNKNEVDKELEIIGQVLDQLSRLKFSIDNDISDTTYDIEENQNSKNNAKYGLEKINKDIEESKRKSKNIQIEIRRLENERIIWSGDKRTSLLQKNRELSEEQTRLQQYEEERTKLRNVNLNTYDAKIRKLQNKLSFLNDNLKKVQSFISDVEQIKNRFLGQQGDKGNFYKTILDNVETYKNELDTLSTRFRVEKANFRQNEQFLNPPTKDDLYLRDLTKNEDLKKPFLEIWTKFQKVLGKLGADILKESNFQKELIILIDQKNKFLKEYNLFKIRFQQKNQEFSNLYEVNTSLGSSTLSQNNQFLGISSNPLQNLTTTSFDGNGNIINQQSATVNDKITETDKDKWKKKLEEREKKLKALQNTLDEGKKQPKDDCPDFAANFRKQFTLKFNKKVYNKTRGYIERFLKRLNEFQDKLETDLTKYIQSQAIIYKEKKREIQEKYNKDGEKLSNELNELNELDELNKSNISKNKSERQALNERLFEENEKLLKRTVENVLYFMRKSVKEYRHFHFDFIGKKIRKLVSYINRLEDNIEAIDLNEEIKSDKDGYEKKIKECSSVADAFNKKFYETFKKEVGAFNLESGAENTKDINADRIAKNRNMRDQLQSDIQSVGVEVKQVTDKIFMYYNDEIKVKYIVFDREFIFLYFLKVISFTFLIFSTYIVENVFIEKCRENGTVLNKNPPNILVFVLICYGVHVAFMVMLLTILLISSLIFTTHQHTFIINARTLVFFLIDYVLTLLFHGIFAMIYAYFVMKKRYFRYKLESLRGLRSLTEFMLFSGIFVFGVPFFMVKWT